jgi:hypothetical protein
MLSVANLCYVTIHLPENNHDVSAIGSTCDGCITVVFMKQAKRIGTNISYIEQVLFELGDKIQEAKSGSLPSSENTMPSLPEFPTSARRLC